MGLGKRWTVGGAEAEADGCVRGESLSMRGIFGKWASADVGRLAGAEAEAGGCVRSESLLMRGIFWEWASAGVGGLAGAELDGFS